MPVGAAEGYVYIVIRPGAPDPSTRERTGWMQLCGHTAHPTGDHLKGGEGERGRGGYVQGGDKKN